MLLLKAAVLFKNALTKLIQITLKSISHYIDLTRAKEFNEKDICTDVEDKKRREAFAADMKDMLQEFIDMGED